MRQPVRHEHTNARGETVRVLGWPVEGAERAVFLHHGLGEHVGRYQTFADQLPEVSLWGYDARGHGELSEKLGHADGLPELARDLDAMVPVLAGLAEVERFVVFGHSMGAAVTLQWLVSHARPEGLDAVILSAPPVAVELDLAQRIKVKVGRLLAKVAPSSTLASGLSQEGISSLPSEVERYRKDPMVHDRISLELARSLIDDAPGLAEHASKIELPVLLLHGSDDPIALPAGSDLLDRRFPNSEKHVFQGARHEVHHDHPAAVEAYFAAVRGFLDAHP